MGFIVAIDGTAGSGKGTVTEIVGRRLGLNSTDTGAMYRCITLYMLENNLKQKKCGTKKLMKKSQQ